MLYNIINMDGVPYKTSKNIIGSIDIIEKIQSYITPTVFKNTYKILLQLKPKLLDHVMNFLWSETEKTFPNYVHYKCTTTCIRKFKMSYMLRGYKRHKYLNSDRSEKIKDNIRNKMTPHYHR